MIAEDSDKRLISSRRGNIHPAVITWHKWNHSLDAEVQGQDTGHLQDMHTWPEEATARAAWGGQTSQGVSGNTNVYCHEGGWSERHEK